MSDVADKLLEAMQGGAVLTTFPARRIRPFLGDGEPVSFLAVAQLVDSREIAKVSASSLGHIWRAPPETP